MRAVSGTLETAQSAVTRTPYYHLLFTSYDGGTTYDFSTDSGDYGNRIKLIDHHEEMFNDYAIIALNNYDRAVPDLRGYWVEIGYGDVTGGGNEYAATPRLWVKYQQTVSIAGRLLTILELEGMWSKLVEIIMRLGNPPYYTAKNINPEDTDYDLADKTVYDLIALIFSEIDPAFTLNALVEDDGIIDTYVPDFSINTVSPFESAGYLITILMAMTKSYLKALDSLQFEIKYPQDSDSVDLTYYSYQAPYFYEFTERKCLMGTIGKYTLGYTSGNPANQVILFANAGADMLWTNIITAVADDEESQDKYGIVPAIVLAPEIDETADAANRAAAILAKAKQEEAGGLLVIPHDCQMELYDKVSVYDAR